MDPAGNYSNKTKAELNPSLILDGKTPRLIDEWQEVPGIWDAVRFDVDKTPGFGKYILTGSVTPPRESYKHSGAGRFAILRMRPMTLYESGDSVGAVSFAQVFSGKNIKPFNADIDLVRLIDITIRGGWPQTLNLPIEKAGSVSVEYIPGWNPGIRSKTRIRMSNKIVFADPSLAIAVLGIGRKHLLEDLNTYGFMFENLCLRDICAYAEFYGGSLYHYRDNSNLEVDAIIEMKDGTWGAFEIKLGENQIEAAACSLIRLRNKLVSNGAREPSCLAVITGGGFGRKRMDGVFVIPINALKP